MSDAIYHLGQRLSLKSQACTVRYIGKVANKTGEWLGVEWDDAGRGRNDGSHDGVRYFDCRSKASTAASFLRVAQPWDKPTTFLQALNDKYFQVEEAKSDEVVFISRTKHIEEVGFEKFALRQAELKGIHVLVLDRMRIGSDLLHEDATAITKICADITDLDLGGNLFEQLEDILKLCSLLPSLRRLTLDGNRFMINSKSQAVLGDVRTVSLANTLLTEDEIEKCLASFPDTDELILADNNLTSWHNASLPVSLKSISLTNNSIRCLDQISAILALPQLQSINLKDNGIKSIMADEATQQVTILSRTLRDLDVGRNKIKSWRFFNYLLDALPALQSLRVSSNPIFARIKSADDKPLAAEDGYMLTIARLPTVKSLNYSVIRETDRLNAEKYYLSQIALEMSMSTPANVDTITAQHPRWSALCQEYGEPVIDYGQSDAMDPNSLAARLVTIHLTFLGNIVPRTWTTEVPRASNIYALYGMVGKELDILPLKLRLVWETGERDPVYTKNDYHGPDWWASSDEDEGEPGNEVWTARSVELVPGTRPVGTYLEGEQASLRVELRQDSQ